MSTVTPSVIPDIRGQFILTSDVVLSPRVREIIRNLDLGVGKKDPPASQFLKPYQNAARWFTIAISPFQRLGDVINTGIWAPFFKEIGNEATEFDHIRVNIENLPEKQINRHIELFELFKPIPRVPDFEAELNELRQVPEKLMLFCKTMSGWANNARCDDTGALKFAIVNYIPQRIDVDTIDPPIVQDPGHKKSISRGFNHRACARLICPRRLLPQFDEDPDLFMARVKCGEIKITAKDFPSFLYDESVAFDEVGLEDGACTGYLMPRVYRHIFCGPSNAFTLSKNKNKRSKRQIHAQTSVTPRTIAYIAVQIYFTLSSADEWTQFIGKFDLEELFDSVLSLFDDDGDWPIKTLKWWNNEIGFRDITAPDSSDTEPDSEPSISERIKWAREKKRLQRQAIATSNPTPQPPTRAPASLPMTNPREPTRAPSAPSPQVPQRLLSPLSPLSRFESPPIDPALYEPREPESQPDYYSHRRDATPEDEFDTQRSPEPETQTDDPERLSQFEPFSQSIPADMAQQFLQWMSQNTTTNKNGRISLYPVNLYQPPRPALRSCQPRATMGRDIQDDAEETQAQGSENESIENHQAKGKRRPARKQAVASQSKRRRVRK